MHLIDITQKDLERSYKQVREELKKYNKNLLKKEEIIVLNKIDLIDEKTLLKIVRSFKKNKRSEILTVSTMEKKSTLKIKTKLLSYVS